MNRTSAILLALAIVVIWSVETQAHHGGALYDSGRTVTVRGPVTEFKFVFPHVLVYINVTEADGATVEWSGELTTPNRWQEASPRALPARSGGLPIRCCR